MKTYKRVYQVICFFNEGGCLPTSKIHTSQHAAKVEAAKITKGEPFRPGREDVTIHHTYIHKAYKTIW